MFADVHTQFFTTAMCFCETKPGFFSDPVCRSVDLLFLGMLVSAGDPNKGPSQKQQTFPWIKYSHHQDLYTGKHCLLSQLPLHFLL